MLVTCNTRWEKLFGVAYLPCHNLEPPTTLSIATLRLTFLCKPKMISSYSAVLFVHSNSKWLETKWFLFLESIKTHITLETSCVFDLSIYKVHKSYIKGPLSTLVLLTLLLLLLKSMVQASFSLVGQGRKPNYVPSGVGIGCVSYHLSCVSIKKLPNKSSVKANSSFLSSKGVTLCFIYLFENTQI